MDWLNHKVDVSLTGAFRNKKPVQDDAWTVGFRPFAITPAQLGEAIQTGLTYGPIFRGDRRKKENFVRCGMISLDFDGDVSPEEAGAHPLVREALTILYTTASDTPARRRFRMIFALEHPIERMTDWVSATRSLAIQLRSDRAAVDGARIFHGSNKGKVRVWDRGLSSDRIAELIEAGKNAFQSEDSNGEWITTGRSTVVLKHDQLVRVSGSNQMVPLQSLQRGTSIHCPRHDDRNASAFVVVSSSNSRKGMRCSTCGLTFWPEEQSFDFYTFDEAVKVTKDFSIHANPSFKLFEPYEESPYKHLFPTQEDVEGITEADIYLLNQRHIGDFPLPRGTTFIKSPKGSGKTEFLSRLVNDPTAKVLLIGHRRSLIRQLCERLGLTCYLDIGVPGKHVDRKRFGVCLDSIFKTPNEIEYDYVLIDESEQVLAHFLSSTMEEKRNSAILKLQHQVSTAQHVVALDADLGWTTFRFVQGCIRRKTVPSHTCIVLNEYNEVKKSLRLYDSKNHLIAAICEAVRQGERCYITSNSKALVKSLHQALCELAPAEEIVSITADNSQQPEIQAFLSNIKERARDFRVILTSPSVSTGVDISFDGEEEVFDHVFGLFQPLITTHFECDQQLMRVRNPKAISVYITPSTHGFETNVDVVKADLLVKRLMDTLIVGYSADGPTFNENHPLLDLACSIVSVERASKNNLKRNFKAYKERQKYPILIIPADPVLANKGKDRMNDAAELVLEKYLSSLCAARQLSRDEMDAVQEMKDNNEGISSDTQASYERTLAELFYREPVSRDLLALDNHGRLMQTVRLFEDMLNPTLIEMGSYVLTHGKWNDPLVKVVQRSHFRILLLREAVMTVGLWGSEGFAWDRVVDHRDCGGLIEFVGKHKAEIESQFGIEVRKDLKDKPIRQLNQLLGFAGLKLDGSKGRITVGDKRMKQYTWSWKAVSVMKEVSDRRRSYPDPWQSPAFTQAGRPSESPSSSKLLSVSAGSLPVSL